MNSETHRSKFDLILAEVLRFEESGEARTTEEWCKRHPDHEDALREFFANREQLGLTRVFGHVADTPTLPGDSSDEDLPGPGDSLQYFGDYEIVKELARGGMGVVYKAIQKSLGRTVALKMILAGEHASEMHVARFRTEAEAAARLDHSGIVPIYEIGEHNGLHYFSMAYIAGDSLADRLSAGPLAPQAAAAIVADAATAVQYAHDLEVIHRDLKPANILMDGDHPKITDFGLAKRLDQQGMTATGEVLGTPGFMAPEQAANAEGADKLSDVYGLGAILYATLTGRPPFQAANVVETLVQLVETDPVAPRQLNTSVPADLETICMAALRKEPGRRYSSAAALEADLRRYLDDRPILARPVSMLEHAVKWSKRRPMIASLSAALLLTLLIGSAIISGLWFRERNARFDAMRAAQRATRNEREATIERANAVAQTKIAQQNLVTSALSIADLIYVNGQAAEAEQRYATEYRAALDRDDGDRRAWWRLWRTYAEYPCVRRLPATGSHVASSADGKYVAVVSGKTVSILDGTTMVLLHTFTSPVGTLARAEFSPDSQLLCANHFAHSPLLVWDPSDSQSEPRQYTLESVPLTGIVSLIAPTVTDEAGLALMKRFNNSRVGFGFGEEGKLLACGPDAMWEFTLGSPEAKPTRVANRQKQGIPGGPAGAAVAQSGNRIWTTNFGSLFGVPLTVVDVIEGGSTEYSYLGIDGKQLITIKPPATLVSALGMPETWRVLPAAQREQLIVSTVFAIHAASLTLAVVEDDVLSTWDLKTGMQLAEMKWRRSSDPDRQRTWADTQLLKFSHDGRTLAAVGEKLRILNVETLELSNEFGWFGTANRASICFTSDGRQLLATDSTDIGISPPIGMYPVESQLVEWLTTTRPQTIAANGAAFTIERPNGPSLFDWTRPTIRMIRDGSETTFTVDASAGMSPNRGLATSADASRVVVAGTSTVSGESGDVLVGFETQSGAMFGPHQIQESAVGLSLSPDGEILTFLNADSVVLHSLPDFAQVAKVKVLRDAVTNQKAAKHGWSLIHRATQYSHDRSRIAVIFNPVKIDIESAFIRAAESAELVVIDAGTPAVTEQLQRSGAEHVLFLANDREIALARSGRTSTVEIYSIPGLKRNHSWHLGADSVTAMAEDSQNHILVAATRDGRLWFWDTQRHEALMEFELVDQVIMDLQFANGGSTLRAVTPSGVLSLKLKPAADRVKRYAARR
jgi:serine/threonine protein kinase/WD40 repeat protein